MKFVRGELCPARCGRVSCTEVQHQAHFHGSIPASSSLVHRSFGLASPVSGGGCADGRGLSRATRFGPVSPGVRGDRKAGCVSMVAEKRTYLPKSVPGAWHGQDPASGYRLRQDAACGALPLRRRSVSQSSVPPTVRPRQGRPRAGAEGNRLAVVHRSLRPMTCNWLRAPVPGQGRRAHDNSFVPMSGNRRAFVGGIRVTHGRFLLL